MQNSFSRRPGFATTFAATLAALALSVSSAETASLQAGTYFQESSNVTSSAPPTAGACNGLVYCYIEFGKIPDGKQLIVTHVSCSLSVSSSTAKSVQVYLGTRKGINAVERFQLLVPGSMPSNQPGYNLVVNAPTLQLYTEKERPEIYVGFTNATDTIGFCTIAGTLQDIP
jgi:hypothetical protein